MYIIYAYNVYLFSTFVWEDHHSLNVNWLLLATKAALCCSCFLLMKIVFEDLILFVLLTLTASSLYLIYLSNNLSVTTDDKLWKALQHFCANFMLFWKTVSWVSFIAEMPKREGSFDIGYTILFFFSHIKIKKKKSLVWNFLNSPLYWSNKSYYFNNPRA